MATLTDAQRSTGWKIVKLGDIAPIKYGKSLPAKKRIPGNVKVYSSAGIIGTHNKAIIDGKNIIIGRKGNIGSISWSDGPAYPIDTVFYTAGTELVDMRFLYYLLSSYDFTGYNTDSAVPGLNRQNFESTEVAIPPIEEQERIASILGSLDDKIEANTHLIQLLEETTKALVREDKSIVTCKISDKLIQSTRQELPITATSDMVYHYSLPAYDCGKTPKLEDPKSIKSNKFLVTEPCLLLSKLNPRTPRIWCVYPKKGYKNYASTEFVVFVPKKHEELAALWVSCSEGSLYKDLEGMAGGTSASHQRVKPVDILMQDISVPKNINIYNSYVSQIESLYSENVHLSTIRDLLIKKLIG